MTVIENTIQEQLLKIQSKNIQEHMQHCLLVLIEKCSEVLDKQGYAGILLTDLSKAFDCINYELLIAKLHDYGFSFESLTFIKAIYLTESKRLNSTLPSVTIVMLNQAYQKGQCLDI